MGDQAPGVMGLLATAMGLEQGPEGMKKLTQLMKQGKIGMKELFNFLDLAAGRAKETGAYDLAINSKQAVETRMANSYKLFAGSVGRMFDEEIKAPFKGFEKFFDKITAWIDEQEKIKKETGEIGKFETSVSLVTTLFDDLGTVLQGIVEGWGNLFSWLPGGSAGGVGGYLAKRQLESSYKDYTATGGNMSKREFARQQFYAVDPFNTEEDFNVFANNLDPTGSLAAGYKIDPLKDKMVSLLESIVQSTKDAAQKLLDAKYNNPVAPVTINVQGVTDPMANAIAVEDIVKDLFRTNR